MRQIPARKTIVVPLSFEEAASFTADHHRQGMALVGKNPQCFALSHENEIVGVAIFCNPRTQSKQRQYTTELFRLSFKKKLRVQGGASKLLKHYMSLPQSGDLFTYQDTGGKASDVYEKAGMRLVGKKYPTKEILVKDGITAATAQNNRSDWFSLAQASLRGPDALIGTSLGEVFEGGKRVSNIELFKRSGYHLEAIPGDRLYEWRNPAHRYYTYKITSSIDESYYYGRHRTLSVTAEEMLHDGYMGSGGVKFQNWVQKVGVESLRKEVLAVYSTWAEVVKAEEELIGDKYKTDAHCKNSKPGGVGLAGYFPKHEMKECPVHGVNSHQGNSCKKCVASKLFSEGRCAFHGITIFQGTFCVKCQVGKSRTLKACSLHGITKHTGASCNKCVAGRVFVIATCSTHGETVHMGASCRKCSVENSITNKTCQVHGETAHIGAACRKCINGKSLEEKECSIHGLSLHQGSTCTLCVGKKSISIKTCPTHGKVKFKGNKCTVCSTQAIVSLKHCIKHGVTKHVGETCKKCSCEKLWTDEECNKHGISRHTKGVCKKCQQEKVWSVQNCSVHGESKHRSDKCVKCAVEAKKRANMSANYLAS